MRTSIFSGAVFCVWLKSSVLASKKTCFYKSFWLFGAQLNSTNCNFILFMSMSDFFCCECIALDDNIKSTPNVMLLIAEYIFISSHCIAEYSSGSYIKIHLCVWCNKKRQVLQRFKWLSSRKYHTHTILPQLYYKNFICVCWLLFVRLYISFFVVILFCFKFKAI